MITTDLRRTIIITAVVITVIIIEIGVGTEESEVDPETADIPLTSTRHLQHLLRPIEILHIIIDHRLTIGQVEVIDETTETAETETAVTTEAVGTTAATETPEATVITDQMMDITQEEVTEDEMTEDEPETERQRTDHRKDPS